MNFIGYYDTINTPISKLKTTKSKFSTDDDNKLRKLVSQYGTKSWSLIASKFRDRNSRQCRERWNNYLSPKNNTSKWTHDEDIQLLRLFTKFGKQWAKLAHYFPERTPVNVRNRYRQLLKRISFNIARIMPEWQIEYNNQVIDSSESFAPNSQIENYIYSLSQLGKLSDFLTNENDIQMDANKSFSNDLDLKQQKILLPPCKDLPFDPRFYVV
ncbi:hypothetical protein M9Y10_018232 [Tritrichomonas musculus]|uniref:Myb-like DNA-binding domain containing protein n=1 Tax=Tritrichomonas musculus TaxID=1915356 RepID=A0ABR2HN30_9EUKA